jgi:hypothetical protein
MSLFVAILLVAGFVLLLLAAFNVAFPPRIQAGWLGLACFGLVYLLLHFAH